MEQHYPELAPISDQAPSGADVRYEAEFEQLQAEIDKLSMPSATGGVDWQKVKSLSSEILRNQSKDLLVAGYLAAAEIRVNSLDGFLAGLQVFGGLLETYWETLFPAKKRMRGRVAAIYWWLEKCEAALTDVPVEPLDPVFVEELRKGVRQIDELLQQYLDDAPLLRPLERIIEDFPVRESAADAKPAARPEEQQPEASSLASSQTGTPAAPQNKEPVEIEAAPTVSSSESLSGAEVEKILRGAFHTVMQAADFYLDKDPANQRSYRCRRIAGWTMIQSLPPANDGQTQVPPPGEGEEIKALLNEYRAVQKWHELLRTSEPKLPRALLWLDLNRFTAESLAGLGTQYQDAHDAVCQETSFLVTRLNGLEKLAFSDGTPLADGETRQWLDELRRGADTSFQTPAPQGGQADEHMGAVLDKAQNLAGMKKLPAGVKLVMDEMQRSTGHHQRLLWQLGLAQLLMNYRQIRLALPHLEEVVRTIDSFKLEQWDPALASQALRIVWLGYRSDKSTREGADAVLARIARLDPVQAMQLEKR